MYEQNKTCSLSIRLTKDLYKKLIAIAKKDKVHKTKFIRTAIAEKIEKREQQEQQEQPITQDIEINPELPPV
jgi:predicted transcriptional regulator